MNKERLVRVDIMVGLAMIFVVLGHQSFSFAPLWYSEGLHTWIYRFHMEAFVFLSAFLIRYSYKSVTSMTEYMRYIGRKFKKFFIPFLIVGLAVAATQTWAMDIKESEFWGVMSRSLQCLVLYPMQSQASFLWYIYILFGFYLISPLIIKLPKWLKMTLCILSIALPLVHCSYMFGGALFCKYGFFYFLGILCAEGFEELRDLNTWVIGLLSLPFLAWTIQLFLAYVNGESTRTFLDVDPKNFDIMTGFLALTVYYFFARLIEYCNWLTRWLSVVSKNCFWIYLLQMFVAWGCAYCFMETKCAEYCPFWVFLLISSLLSLAFPIAVAKLSVIVAQLGNKKHINSKEGH